MTTNTLITPLKWQTNPYILVIWTSNYTCVLWMLFYFLSNEVVTFMTITVIFIPFYFQQLVCSDASNEVTNPSSPPQFHIPVWLLPVQMDACFTDWCPQRNYHHRVWVHEITKVYSTWRLMLCELTDGHHYLCVFMRLYSRSGNIGASGHLEKQPVLSSEARLVDLARKRLKPKYHKLVLKVLQEEKNLQNWM